MLEYKKEKEKEIKIVNLQKGQIFKVNGKLFAFIRIKRGGKNMVATKLENGQDYNVRIFDIFDSKTVYGILTEKKKHEKTDITLKDVKVGESFIVMTGRGQAIPQLYTLVEITNKAYSHVLQNPVTGKKEQFKPSDSWKVFRLNDLIK